MTDQSPNARFAILRPLLLLTLPLLAACVERAPPGAVVETADAAAGVEPQSGIAKDALVAVSYMKSEKFFVVFYRPAKINAKQKADAPTRLCDSRGLKLASVEDKPLEHPSEMPGTQKLVVRCT
jgi:hypothetical protein